MRDGIKDADAVNPKAVAAQLKPPLDLLEREALEQIAYAMATGAKKYGRGNYHTIPVYYRTYAAAILRHTYEWLSGVEEDADSGLHPLAHVGACVNIMLATIAGGNAVDDRGAEDRSDEQEAMSSSHNVPSGDKPIITDTTST